jgi:predicted metal-binding membrane protein
MNLVWIAALAIVVLIERVLPAGKWISRGAAVALTGWGVATLVA